MHEQLIERLGDSARSARALYDPASGGYHLPLREHNRPLRPADVATLRRTLAEPMYDCVELPVADLLASLVLNTRSAHVLETGTSRGYSTAHLAAAVDLAAGADGRVVTIDPAPAPHPFHAELRLRARLEVLREDALAVDAQALAAGRPFDLMLLDSLHTYGHLSREILHFLPVLRTGGLLVLHDSLFFDALGLVVLALQRCPAFEVLTLPTHRRHRPGWRSPGVTLVRKLRPLGDGELAFPALDDLLGDERAELAHGATIAERSGELFRDPRYAAARALVEPDRTPASVGLLDPAGEPAPPVPAAPRRPATRRRHADAALREAEAAWWRDNGDLEARFTWQLPDAFAPPPRQRIAGAIAAALAGCRHVVDLGCGDGRLTRWLHGQLDARLTGADSSPAQMALARAAPVDARPDAPPIDWQLADGPRTLPRADGWLLHGVLHHLAQDDIERLLDELRAHVPAGATIVLVEPVCFPGHPTEARDRPLLDGIARLLAEPARAAQREGVQPSADARALRERLARRWWGELPYGPSPLEKPFEHDELHALLAERFDAGVPRLVQYLGGTQALGGELALLALDAPALAGRLAETLMPALDALEQALIAAPRPPDTAWYLSMWTLRAR